MTAAFELEKSRPAESYSYPFLTSPILLAFSEIIARASLLTRLIPQIPYILNHLFVWSNPPFLVSECVIFALIMLREPVISPGSGCL